MKKHLIIGIGSKAKAVIDNLYIKERNFDFLCLNNHKQFLNLSKIKTVWFNDNEFQQTESDIKYHLEILKNKNDILKKELKKYKYAIIVLYLGEQFTLNTIEIIKYFKEHLNKFDILGVKPFKFEGVLPNYNADEIVKNLADMGYTTSNNLFLYNSDEIYDIYKPDSNLDAEKHLIKKAGEVLKMIYELSSKE